MSEVRRPKTEDGSPKSEAVRE